jgi:hypothetical protein
MRVSRDMATATARTVSWSSVTKEKKNRRSIREEEGVVRE